VGGKQLGDAAVGRREDLARRESALQQRQARRVGDRAHVGRRARRDEELRARGDRPRGVLARPQRPNADDHAVQSTHRPLPAGRGRGQLDDLETLLDQPRGDGERLVGTVLAQNRDDDGALDR
jgi:hypothetical protein